MGKTVAQNSSANIVLGPFVNISASVMSALTIANTAIVLIKESSTSAARVATTSALSVGPGFYRVVLNTADTDTLGTLTIIVSGSGAMLYSKDVEIWQSTTWNLYFGSADQILTSAAASAIVSVGVNAALVNYDVPTSADVSAIVSAVISGVLNSYNVASAGEVASAGVNSAGISAIVQGAFANYDLPTSADVSTIVAANAGAGINSAQASTIMVQVLTDYDAPTSADISAIGVQVLTNYDVPTSADVSVIVSVVVA